MRGDKPRIKTGQKRPVRSFPRQGDMTLKNETYKRRVWSPQWRI